MDSVTGTGSPATLSTIYVQSTTVSPSSVAVTSHSLTGGQIGGIVGGVAGGFILIFIVLGFLFIKGKHPPRDQDQPISGAANLDRLEDKEESYSMSQGEFEPDSSGQELSGRLGSDFK